jgi:hypothetical protein
MVSPKPVPLEQRVRDKSLKKVYQACKAELKEEIRQSKVTKRTKWKELHQRRPERNQQQHELHFFQTSVVEWRRRSSSFAEDG